MEYISTLEMKLQKLEEKDVLQEEQIKSLDNELEKTNAILTELQEEVKEGKDEIILQEQKVKSLQKQLEKKNVIENHLQKRFEKEKNLTNLNRKNFAHHNSQLDNLQAGMEFYRRKLGEQQKQKVSLETILRRKTSLPRKHFNYIKSIHEDIHSDLSLYYQQLSCASSETLNHSVY